MWGRLLGLALVAAAGALAACGGGDAKPAAAPGPPPRPMACFRVGAYAEPFVEGWRDESARADVEAAMKTPSGIAVVSYDCHGLRVLKGCKLRGSYAFGGIARDEGSFQITDPDEVAPNLPLSGPALAKEIKPGRQIDVAYFAIGEKITPRSSATRADLQGDCAGATHFVRAAQFGALATTIGPTPDHVRNTAEIFTGSTGVTSEDEYLGGSAEDPCRGSTSDATSPPPRCAIVRLELVGIGPEAAYDASAIPPDGCPEGLVRIGGKCGRPTKDKPYACSPKDVSTCAAECDKGDARSCYALGLASKGGAAESAFARAADGGNTRGMYELALARSRAHDPQKAELLLAKACSTGDAWVCFKQGTFLDSGEILEVRSPSRAFEAYRRGCNLGSGPACARVASMYLSGTGTAADRGAANDVLTRACDSDDAASCGVLGAVYATGQGVPRDPAKAKALLERGCRPENFTVDACTALAALYEEGDGVPKDRSRAVELYERSCRARDVRACSHLCKQMKDRGACERLKKIQR